MSTETYYVVRNEDGGYMRQVQVDAGYPSEYTDWDYMSDLSDATRMSRSAAEDAKLAAEPGCTVQRVTVTTEDVGLRWDHDSQRARLFLRDGKAVLAAIRTPWDESETIDVYECRLANGVSSTHDTIEEAKAAAEAAVRETWT